jgi:hypothetical protein
MERRYVVAALAIIAAFSVTSYGFRGLENLSQARHPSARVSSNCGVNSVVVRTLANVRCRVLAKIRTRLHRQSPEEAQLLAEMDLPAIGTEAGRAAQTARQDAAAAQCARAQALREADRARREAMSLQQEVTRSLQANPGPPSFRINLPADLDQQIQAQMSRAASQLAAGNVKLQIAADQLRANAGRLRNLELPAIDVKVPPSSSLRRHVGCGAAQPQ